MNKTLRTNLVATNVLVIIHRLIERSSTTTFFHLFFLLIYHLI